MKDLKALALVDLRGVSKTPPGPASLIFMQFSGKIWLNDRLAPLPWVLATLRLGNSGSVIVYSIGGF